MLTKELLAPYGLSPADCLEIDKGGEITASKLLCIQRLYLRIPTMSDDSRMRPSTVVLKETTLSVPNQYDKHRSLQFTDCNVAVSILLISLVICLFLMVPVFPYMASNIN